MTEHDDLELVLDRFFGEGPEEMDDRVIEVSLLTIDTTRQRRAIFGSRRVPMPLLRQIAIATLAVLVFAAIGVLALPRPSVNIAATPAASAASPNGSPGPSSTTAPTASTAARLLDTSTWTSYRSTQYGFTMAYPPGWVSYPASMPWKPDGKVTDPLSPGMDSFMSPDSSVRVSAWVVPDASATQTDGPGHLEQWVASYCAQTINKPCTGIHERATPLCNERRDCHPAMLVPFENDVEAFAAGGTFPGVLVMAVWRADAEPTVAPFGGATRLLEAFLSTAGVFPRPTLPTGSPDAFGLTTFTSPLYSYTVDVSFSWTRTPATQAWLGDDGIEDRAPAFSDVFHDNASGVHDATIKALALPAGTTDAAWLTQWQAMRAIGGRCLGSSTGWADATVAGHPASTFKWRCNAGPSGISDYDEYAFLADGKGFVISGNPVMVDVLVRSFRMP
jgi:hypothetical protein